MEWCGRTEAHDPHYWAPHSGDEQSTAVATCGGSYVSPEEGLVTSDYVWPSLAGSAVSPKWVGRVPVAESDVVLIAVLHTTAQGEQLEKIAKRAARELQLQFGEALVDFRWAVNVPTPTSDQFPVHTIDVSKRIDRKDG